MGKLHRGRYLAAWDDPVLSLACIILDQICSSRGIWQRWGPFSRRLVGLGGRGRHYLSSNTRRDLATHPTRHKTSRHSKQGWVQHVHSLELGSCLRCFVSPERMHRLPASLLLCVTWSKSDHNSAVFFSHKAKHNIYSYLGVGQMLLL